MKKKILALSLALLAIVSCQNEAVEVTSSAGISNDVEVTAKSIAEFNTLIKTNPGYVLKIDGVLSDTLIDVSKMSEQEFLSHIKLVDMPRTHIVESDAFAKGTGDGIVTLPEIVVHGSWPATGHLNSLLATPNWWISGSDMGYVNSNVQLIEYIRTKEAEDPSHPFKSRNILPAFDFNKNLLRVKFEIAKTSINKLRGELGISDAKDWKSPADYAFDGYGNIIRKNYDKGNIQFSINTTSSGTLTSVTFEKGFGSYKVNLGGQSITMTSSTYTVVIDKSGAITNLKLATGNSNVQLWAAGNPKTSSLNVGFSAGNKVLTTSVSGGFNNGKATGTFQTTYQGLLSGHMTYNGGFETGIEFQVKY